MVKQDNVVAVQLTPTRVAPYREGRTSLTVFNNDAANTIYLGSDSQVAVAGGLPVLPQTGFSFLEGLGDDTTLEMWAITVVGASEMRWWESTVAREKLARLVE